MALPVKMASCFGVLEYWGIAKYQIPNIKSQGFRCSAGGGSGVGCNSVTRCQVSGKINIEAET